MSNIANELYRLRISLESKGLNDNTIAVILSNAQDKIERAFQVHSEAAMNQAIEAGIDKRCAEFINELQVNVDQMELSTQSGNTEFTEPPFPMLTRLLQGAKPMKDGSGVYKVIPVGGSGTSKPKVATNIYDATKQVNAERMENARRQYQAIAPKGSASEVQFRTATSKQDPNQQWVIPAKTKDFSEELQGINRELSRTMEDAVQSIILEYEESY